MTAKTDIERDNARISRDPHRLYPLATKQQKINLLESLVNAPWRCGWCATKLKDDISDLHTHNCFPDFDLSKLEPGETVSASGPCGQTDDGKGDRSEGTWELQKKMLEDLLAAP